MITLRRLAPALAAAVAALAASFAYNAVAVPRMAPPPAAIATVDLVRVIDKLTERSDWEVQITALQKRIQDELTAKRKTVEDDAKKMEGAAEAERSAIRDRLALEQLRMEQWAKIKQIELDRERALMWQSMYRNVRAESAKLAEAEGYDLVLVNDGVNDLQIQRDSKVSQEQQAQEQIVRRRVLYSAKNIDVTDKLILRMNNARSAASKVAAPAGAPQNSETKP